MAPASRRVASYLHGRWKSFDDHRPENRNARKGLSVTVTSIQIIEKDGQPAFAVVPIEIWERVRGLVEDLEDVAAFDTALSAHDEFTIPFAVVKAEFAEGVHAVRAWREHRRLTQDQLAQRAGISKAYLSQIEGGKRAGSTATMRKLAAALQVPVRVLLER